MSEEINSSALGTEVTSATDALREKMKSGSSGSSEAMVQGDDYSPTVEHTGDIELSPDEPTKTKSKSTKEKPKIDLNPKQLLGIIAGIIIVGILIVTLMGSSENGNEQTENTVSIVQDTTEPEWIIETTTPFSYSITDIERLREVGYTGTEIEEYQSLQISVDDLVNEAIAKRDAWIQEAVAPLYDTASDQFKEYVSSTWLSLSERDDLSEWTKENIAMSYVLRKNLDYEKIDVRGNQLYIKIYLDTDSEDNYFFLNVTPLEWSKLKDKGNVIVNYTYFTHYKGEGWDRTEDVNNIFITDATLEIIE